MKAGRPHDSAVAKAYDIRKQADQLQSGPQKRERFASAALAFRACATDAAHGSDYSYELHEKAGDCFYGAADLLAAAESYITANKITTVTKAALIYRRLGKFKEAVALAKPPAAASLVAADAREDIIEVAKMEFTRRNDFKFVCLVLSAYQPNCHFAEMRPRCLITTRMNSWNTWSSTGLRRQGERYMKQ